MKNRIFALCWKTFVHVIIVPDKLIYLSNLTKIFLFFLSSVVQPPFVDYPFNTSRSSHFDLSNETSHFLAGGSGESLFQGYYDSQVGESSQGGSFSGRSEGVGSQQPFSTDHICDGCGKKYKWLDSLKRHKRVECGNKEKRHICRICGRKYKYRYELTNHLSSQHSVQWENKKLEKFRLKNFVCSFFIIFFRE